MTVGGEAGQDAEQTIRQGRMPELRPSASRPLIYVGGFVREEQRLNIRLPLRQWLAFNVFALVSNGADSIVATHHFHVALFPFGNFLRGVFSERFRGSFQ